MRIFGAAAGCVCASLLCFAAQERGPWDLVIRGGRVIDGTGARIYAADLAVHDGKVVELGYVQKPGRRTIDARGYCVAPGFIDMHTHSEYSLLEDGRALSNLYQGITTVVLGEHTSPGPMLGKAQPVLSLAGNTVPQNWKTLGEYFSRLEKQGVAVNVASYVASGQVRACVVGYENRPATPSEMQEMKQLVSQAMDEGAMGLSSGLSYVPNVYASTQELTELAAVAAAKNGIYATHMRSLPSDPFAGLRECLRIAEVSRAPVEIFHINSSGAARIMEYASMVEAARKKGLSIEANIYPYTAGMTFLSALLPEWAQEGGMAATLARLDNGAQRKRIVAELQTGKTFAGDVPWDKRRVSSRNPALDGKSLAQIAAEKKMPPAEALVDMLISEKGDGLFISHGNTEENLIRSIKLPWAHVGSDGAAVSTEVKGAGMPHPRFFGTFPRFLGKYVRDEQILGWEEMIHRMTWHSAQRLRIKDRGRIATGMAADLVIFHPERIRDLATFEEPARYSEGVQWLIVNGRLVLDEGRYTGALPGKIVRGPGYRGPALP